MPLASAEEFFAFLKELHNECQPLTLRLRFDKQHAQQRTVVALYGSVMELTSALIALVEQQLLPGVPVLLRAILEAHVDLTNMAGSARYGYALERSYVREWRKLLQEAQGGKNEYLLEISGEPTLAQRIQDLHHEEAKLEAKGHRILSMEQKFRQAGMEKEYRSLYNSLCCDSHNNLRALVDRHFEFEAEDFTVVFYKAYTPEDAALHVGTSAEILMRATETLHAKLESPAQARVAELRARLNGLRGET